MATESSFSHEPTITFLGHAGFDVRHGAVRLVVDPWLGGAVFDAGWELLLPPPGFDAAAPVPVTHLWISHEHPDHFNPGTLRQIPAELRSSITAIVARSEDSRVAEFLRGQGYRVVEPANGQAVRLGDGITLTTVGVSGGDSCHLLDLGGFRILNTNDCAFDASHAFDEVLRLLGLPEGEGVDLLLTQFSYANWIGNPDEYDKRKAFAQHKLDLLFEQIELAKPRHVFPCASFVRFAHEENAYLNDATNDFGTTCDAVARRGPIAIAMRPGETITLDDVGLGVAAERVPQVACELADAMAKVRRGELPLVRSDPVALDELVSAAEGAMRRLADGMVRVDRVIVGLQQRQAVFEVADHDVLLVLERCRTVRIAPSGSERADIRLSSSALAYALRNDFGFETLLINGRLTVCHDDGLVPLLKLTGQFGYLRRRESVVRSIARRRVGPLVHRLSMRRPAVVGRGA